MPDIRDRIEEDRGILKKIQTYVPGFRGYRRREDLRDADRMLRAQLTQKLSIERRGLEECRGLLVQSYGSKEMELIGGLINQFKKIEGLVLHAETGYSGFVADIQIKEEQLDKLYEYDAGMLDHLTSITVSIESLKNSLMAADEATSHRDIMNIRARITDFEDKFNRRMRVIEGTEV
ncbi:MAG: hypothetical protein KKE24_09170 [Candidatus Thermoplasmatota archaeon]|nr:hypothetical protein [Candidatus Thermoplasmatota archaeon]